MQKRRSGRWEGVRVGHLPPSQIDNSITNASQIPKLRIGTGSQSETLQMDAELDTKLALTKGTSPNDFFSHCDV